jgi:deoxyribodipyrimidine photolyase-related protein
VRSVRPSGVAPAVRVRRLVILLADQLDESPSALDGFDKTEDAVWMAEVAGESLRVPSHRARTVLFLSALRHRAQELVDGGHRVLHRRLGEHDAQTLGEALAQDLATHAPTEIVGVLPGDWHVKQDLEAAAARTGRSIEWREDTHFLSTPEEFRQFATGRRMLRMEHWYRMLRRRTGILMRDGEPVGGEFNFDADNRETFGKKGPGALPTPKAFAPDAMTREVMDAVERHLPDLPGSLARFDWPVTRADARAALDDFIANRLTLYGHYQDAIWNGEAYLYHSRLAAALNLKLLDPRVAIEAAVTAYERGHAPLNAVEGFVRQILGWREYVRGIYWLLMPDYGAENALDAKAPLPSFFWTGKTDYACLSDTISRTLEHGYAHHIERLMITGLFCLLLGVDPREVQHWYLGVYVDAVEWVELPNVVGMSQYADGGRLASKPYIASGRYIDRMSNHCSRCPRRPDEATGPRACPFTTLYWDFLDRHRARFVGHPRLGQQIRNLDARPSELREAIRLEADALREQLKT